MQRPWSRVLRTASAIGLVVASIAAVTGPIASADAAPTTLFVNRASSACSDTGSGSSAAPFCTIRRAAAVATAGQTVIVSPGTYAGDISPAASGTASAPIVFTATGGVVTINSGVNGFKISGRSRIVLNGFTVTGTTGPGIYLLDAHFVVVTNNRVSSAGAPKSGAIARGIRVGGSTIVAIVHNTTDHNTDAGIGVSGSDGNVITNNTSFANARGYTRAAAGIDVRDGGLTELTGNTTYGNEDSGLNIWTGTVGTLARNNVVYANGDHGIDVHDATNATVVANTVSGNVDSGIEMTTSKGTVLANNVTVDNGINSPRTSGNVRADSASVGSTTLDYDLVYLRVAGVMIDWAGALYSSMAAFQAATGRELHGLQGDPRFAGASSGNFHLLAGSRAIDDANAGASGQPSADFDGRARRDDPGTPNTGVGPNPFTDRGAFEF